MITVFTVQEIKKVRENAGITQTKMAKILGVSLNTYQRYEKREDMLFSQVVRCSEYLKKIEEAEKSLKKDKKQ